LTKRGIYWDLGWSVDELRDWLMTKPRSSCKGRSRFSMRIDGFAIHAPDGYVLPKRDYYVRINYGTLMVAVVGPINSPDFAGETIEGKIPATSRQSAIEGAVLQVSIVADFPPHRITVGSNDVPLMQIMSRDQIDVHDAGDHSVFYGIRLSQRRLTQPNVKFRLAAWVVVAVGKIRKLYKQSTENASKQVLEEITQLEQELLNLKAENDRLRNALLVELKVKKTRAPGGNASQISVSAPQQPTFVPIAVPAPAPVIKYMDATPENVKPPARLVSVKKHEEPPTPKQPVQDMLLSIPEPAISRSFGGPNVAMKLADEPSVAELASQRIRSWLEPSQQEDPAKKTNSLQPMNEVVLSQKVAKMDKTAEISMVDIASVVFSQGGSWVSSLIGSSEPVFNVVMVFTNIKDKRPVDVTRSANISFKGAKAAIPKDNKLVIRYISQELDQQVLQIAMVEGDHTLASGAVSLNELLTEKSELTVELISQTDALLSNPQLTVRYIAPPAPVQPKAAKAPPEVPKTAPAPPPKAEAPPPKKMPIPTDPKQRALYVAQQRQLLVKAKMAMIAKAKEEAAKKNDFITAKEKEISSLAKVLPPVDAFKFPGMPGPPPFKPKGPPPTTTEPEPPSEIN
jgi:hypothetical protein